MKQTVQALAKSILVMAVIGMSANLAYAAGNTPIEPEEIIDNNVTNGGWLKDGQGMVSWASNQTKYVFTAGCTLNINSSASTVLVGQTSRGAGTPLNRITVNTPDCGSSTTYFNVWAPKMQKGTHNVIAVNAEGKGIALTLDDTYDGWGWKDSPVYEGGKQTGSGMVFQTLTDIVDPKGSVGTNATKSFLVKLAEDYEGLTGEFTLTLEARLSESVKTVTQ
ncbi:hypothetical protein [Escherichia coli]|uniref:hypothetical protein n=1 Tax=Escherichia coli TaxID=562 RepID=UPI0010DF6B09|nr:hypothetical protein [Escherichia coli]GDO98313.1 hypothetical protein BvCmsNSNP012_01617 [Escherichia coli]